MGPGLEGFVSGREDLRARGEKFLPRRQGLGARTEQLGAGVGGLAAGFEDFAAR